jgi:Tfp pilus assembly protein PilW
MMIRKPLRNISGVTMIELIIVMAIVVFVLAATSRVLTALVTQFKQQSKVMETSVEEVVGYEMLRRDVQAAGYGLATALSDGTSLDITSWEEGTNITGYVEVNSPDPEAVFDDHIINSPPTALIAVTTPADIVSAPFINAVAGSDYLVIKSILVARNDEAGKFHNLASGDVQNTWTPADANLDDTDRVIVLTLRQITPVAHITLITNTTGGTRHFFTTKNATANYAPTDSWERRVVYGVDDTDLSAPFNRADYVVATNADLVPTHCAENTGVLLKRVMKHNGDSGGTFPVPSDSDYADYTMPLLDCVADMQVSYVDDANTEQTDITGLSAAQVRTDVREVRVYILTHEGQKDPTFQYPSSTVYVGNEVIGTGRSFDLTAIPDYENYRWKLLTLAEKPMISR